MENLIITHLKTNSQNLEMWIAHDTDKNLSIGHVFMIVEKDNRIKFLDAWIHEDYRRKGLYRKLWNSRWNFVSENYKGYLVYAWCKDSSLPISLENGFTTGEKATYVERII